MTATSASEAERWEEWRARNAASERRSALYARTAAAVILCAALMWVAIEVIAARATGGF